MTDQNTRSANAPSILTHSASICNLRLTTVNGLPIIQRCSATRAENAC